MTNRGAIPEPNQKLTTMRYSNEIVTFRLSGIRVRQVNKTTARRLYNASKEIYLVPCNMLPNDPWMSPLVASQKLSEASFEAMLNCFQWYNCDAERGKYANFFVEVD